MSKILVYLSWERDGIKKNVVFSVTESYSHKDLSITPTITATEWGEQITLQCKAHFPVILTRLALQMTPDVKREARMMVNGFQTWTQSRELSIHDQIPPLRWFVRRILGPYGDYNIRKAPTKVGHFQSWTYTYFRRPGRPFFLIGSIDESFAYTVFEYDFSLNLLCIEKEFDQLLIQDESTPFQLYIGEGREDELWKEYHSIIPQRRTPLSKCTGWTSWYYYYTKITQEMILDNLHTLTKAQIPLDVFQIDDGYQKAIGDWLLVNDKFPIGMAAVASKIRAAGYRPGLWLAPFICEERSQVYQAHPEWLLRDAKGNPVKAGFNPGWNGWFYAMDLYAPGFREHLQQVFRTVLDEWGYEMVKLDFLYAVALLPRTGKTRGQVMSDALSLICEAVGDRWILGCGVPLGPAFGQMDYCRIGSDVAPYWEDAKLNFVHYRERVSTSNSLLSTIGRWQLNGRTFFNDPDVFILRDRGNKLTDKERYTLFLLNNLFGGLVFFSDHIGEYTAEQMNRLLSMFPTVEPQIHEVTESKGKYTIKCTIAGKEYHIHTNLSDKPVQISTFQPYYGGEKGYIPVGTTIELQAHESICLYTIHPSRKEPFLLGTTGHLFPGAELKAFHVEGDQVEISLHAKAAPGTKVVIGVPNHLTYIKINGKLHSAKLNQAGARYISISKTELAEK